MPEIWQDVLDRPKPSWAVLSPLSSLLRGSRLGQPPARRFIWSGDLIRTGVVAIEQIGGSGGRSASKI